MSRKSIACILSLMLMLVSLNSAAFAADRDGSESIQKLNGNNVILANNGSAMYGVFVSSGAGVMESHAAEELVDYLSQVSNATFQLSTGSAPLNGSMILVGRNASTESLVPELTGNTLGEDGFVIRYVSGNIVIAGSHPRGTMYGVNYFLDYYVGVKWFSSEYTYVPNKPNLELNVDNDVQVPRFEYREMYINDGDDEQYRAHNLLNGKYRDRYVYVPSSPAYLNSWSNYWPDDVHNFFRIVPQTEYHYGNQLLAMSEDVRTIASDKLIEIINQRISDGKDASYAFSQEDMFWVPDADSQAFAEAHGNTLAAPIFDMVGDVANRVRDEIPNARIGTYAYWFTEQAPTGMQIPDNVVVTFAPIYKDNGRALNDPKNQFSHNNAEQWADLSTNIIVWDYLTDFGGGGYLMPYPSLYAMSETIQYMADSPAFKGYFGQHMDTTTAPKHTGLTDMRAWVGARLLWNPDQDYLELIEQFINGYYGDAAPYILDYVTQLHEKFEESDSKLTTLTSLWSSYLSFDLIHEADQLFAQAAAAVANNPVMLNHVQRTRIELDYVILMRSVEFMREAMNRNITWNADYANRLQRFKTYTSDIAEYKIGSSMASLYTLLEIERTVSDVPDFVQHLPASAWMEYQDSSFRLWAPAGAALVQDAKASDSAAARIGGDQEDWAVQLTNSVLPKEGEWKLYASVRVDPGDGAPNDKAFEYGIFPSDPPWTLGAPEYGDFSDGEYHWVEFPVNYEYDPAIADRYIFFAPPKSTAIQYLYVDRIIAVKQTVAEPPTNVQATAGNGKATVSFTSPINDGGSPIISYTVTAWTGGTATSITATDQSSPITVTGLSNGTPYTFTVTAKNANGDSAASASSNEVTPSTAPLAPANLASVAGDKQVILNWGTVTDSDSYSVYKYEGSAAPADANNWILVDASVTATTYTVTGLTNGTSYSFTVKALGEGGTSEFSAATVAMPTEPQPPAPGIPANLTSVAGDKQVNLQWNAATNAVNYEVYKFEGATAPADENDWVRVGDSVTATTYTVTGLTNGTSYSFAVKAVGEGGTSGFSEPTTAKPYATESVTPGGNIGIGGSRDAEVIKSANGTVAIPVGRAGEVSLDGEINIAAPVGAAEQELRIKIEKMLNTVGLLTDKERLLSSVFEVTKNVTGNFKTPVTLSIKFDPSKVGENQRVAIFFYDEGKKTWIEAGGIVDGTWITVKVDHFTMFAAMAVDISKNEEPVISFTDIVGHWGERSIISAVSQKLVKGYRDGTFRPDASITRAEFTTMLVNALKLNRTDFAPAFTDQAKVGVWAQQAIAQAVQAGIVSGYKDGSFRPDAIITRVEMAVMMARALGLSGGSVIATAFADDKDVPQWAKSAVEAMRKQGIVSGRGNNKFVPNGKATRAEAVTMVLAMLEYQSRS